MRIARRVSGPVLLKTPSCLLPELALTSAKTGYINAINSYYTALAELKKESGLSDDSIIFEKGEMMKKKMIPLIIFR